MGELGRKLESAEIALLELYGAFQEEGETAHANEVARVSRMISKWRNE